MRSGALKVETPSARVAHRYWTYSLWLVAGVTLLALLAHNVVLFQLDVMHVFISVLFALLSSVALLMVLKSVLGSKSPRLMKAFFVFSNVRLLAAILLIVGYAWVSHLSGKELLPFVIVLSVYFILQDVLDTLFVVKLHKSMEQC